MLLQPTAAFASAAVAYKRRFQQVRAGTGILCSGGYDLNVLLDFFGYRRGVFADALGDTFEGNAMEQTLLNLGTIIEGEVLACAGALL